MSITASCGLAAGLGTLGPSGEKPGKEDRVKQKGRGRGELCFHKAGGLCVPLRVRTAGSFLE